jgi:hypothetical protein
MLLLDSVDPSAIRSIGQPEESDQVGQAPRRPIATCTQMILTIVVDGKIVAYATSMRSEDSVPVRIDENRGLPAAPEADPEQVVGRHLQDVVSEQHGSRGSPQHDRRADSEKRESGFGDRLDERSSDREADGREKQRQPKLRRVRFAARGMRQEEGRFFRAGPAAATRGAVPPASPRENDPNRGIGTLIRPSSTPRDMPKPTDT